MYRILFVIVFASFALSTSDLLARETQKEVEKSIKSAKKSLSVLTDLVNKARSSFPNQKAFDTFKSDFEKLALKLNELQKFYDADKAENDRLSNTSRTLSRENEAFRRENTRLESEKTDLIATKKSLTTDIEEFNKVNRRLIEDNAELTKQKTTLRESKLDLQEKVQTFKLSIFGFIVTAIVGLSTVIMNFRKHKRESDQAQLNAEQAALEIRELTLKISQLENLANIG